MLDSPACREISLVKDLAPDLTSNTFSLDVTVMQHFRFQCGETKYLLVIFISKVGLCDIAKQNFLSSVYIHVCHYLLMCPFLPTISNVTYDALSRLYRTQATALITHTHTHNAALLPFSQDLLFVLAVQPEVKSM